MALGRWSRLADLTDAGLVRPAARSEHIGTWNEARQVLLIHGGSNLEGDLWTFDATSDSWARTVTAEAPAARTLHAAGWDAANQALWVHGGHNSQTATWYRDIWRFHSGIWVQVSNDAGPSGRQAHVAVWVPGTFSLWVHGGWTGTNRLSDLWSYNEQGHGWWELAPSGAPPARSHHVAVWDGVGQALWMHGGFGDSRLLGDLWTLDASTGSWSERSYDGGPSARSGHTAVWDDGSRMLWLHGGNDGFPKQDLWRYDSGQNMWSLISAEHAGPSGRWSHVAAWGSGNQVIYIHGGILDKYFAAFFHLFLVQWNPLWRRLVFFRHYYLNNTHYKLYNQVKQPNLKLQQHISNEQQLEQQLHDIHNWNFCYEHISDFQFEQQYQYDLHSNIQHIQHTDPNLEN
ncbi:Lztr1 [Symbiodinium necroappetens]|uniref:Lztr1 protein n=1 Tax=Symbiodinium necroappetens TaxID=1628268 RepID=A0A812W3C0_9DINO|nr:Lztr1 [Symbiodinium necroappetens]